MGQTNSREQRMKKKSSMENMEHGIVHNHTSDGSEIVEIVEIAESTPKFAEACRTDRNGSSVKDMLEKGADPNLPNGDSKYSALHIAAEACNESALRILLEHHSSDANILDIHGNNVLHILCSQKSSEEGTNEDLIKCVKTVLDVCETHQNQAHSSSQNTYRNFLNINYCNQKGKTPIFLAAENKNADIVQILLNHGSSIDADNTGNDKRARNLLEDWNIFKEKEMPKEELIPGLQFLLYDDGNEKDFCGRLKEESVEVHDGRQTLLQIATERRRKDAVQLLLKLGADVNRTIYDVPPCEIAAKYGHHEILEKLIADPNLRLPENGRSVIFVCIDAASNKSTLSEDFRKTFEVLLRRKDICDINAPDKNGYTPLHFAINCGVSPFVVRLIEEGALLGIPDRHENIPLDIVSLTDFRNFLDGRISCEDYKTPRKRIIFDVEFLKFFDKGDLSSVEQYGCQSLIAISKNEELRNVLTHPIVTCFLNLKWKAISVPFRFFLLVHLILYFLFLGHVLVGDFHLPSNASATRNESISDESNREQTVIHLLPVTILHYLIMIVFFFLAIITTLYRYVTWEISEHLEVFLLKIPLAVCCIVILAGVSNEFWRVTVAVSAVLLSSADCILLVGGIPKLSIYVKMLQIVSSNFLMFFLWSSPLLLAFTFSFVLVFGERSDKSSIESLSYYLFKNIIMITGEYESGELMQKAKIPVLSHAVFILFVFFIAIVLFNLLTALAVSDTKDIIEHAELHAAISRIKLMRCSEVFIRFLREICRVKENERTSSRVTGIKCQGTISRCIVNYMNCLSLKQYVDDGKIYVQPNIKNKLKTSSSKNLCINSKVVRLAEKIWKSRSFKGEETLQI